MGWLIALAVLLAIGCIPLGVFIRFDSGGLLVRIVAGLLRFTVVPFPKREKKTKSKNKSAASQPPKEKSPDSQPQPEPKGGSLRDFYPLMQTALDFMGQFRRKLRVDDLVLKVTLGGDDPCDLAVNYGRAWAALGNLVPLLERHFRIRKRDLEVQCDFTAEETQLEAQAKLTLTVEQLLHLGIVYGYLFIKELLILKKKRKGGTES